MAQYNTVTDKNNKISEHRYQISAWQRKKQYYFRKAWQLNIPFKRKSNNGYLQKIQSSAIKQLLKWQNEALFYIPLAESFGGNCRVVILDGQPPTLVNSNMRLWPPVLKANPHAKINYFNCRHQKSHTYIIQHHFQSIGMTKQVVGNFSFFNKIPISGHKVINDSSLHNHQLFGSLEAKYNDCKTKICKA